MAGMIHPCRLIVTTNSHAIISIWMQDVIWITARLCFSTTSEPYGNGFVDCQPGFASQSMGNTVLARW